MSFLKDSRIKGSENKQKMTNCIFRDFRFPFYVVFLPANSVIMLYIHQKVVLLNIYTVSHSSVIQFEISPSCEKNSWQSGLFLPLSLNWHHVYISHHLHPSSSKSVSAFFTLFGQNGKQLYKNVPLLDFLSFCNFWCGSKIQHVWHGKFISKIDISWTSE